MRSRLIRVTTFVWAMLAGASTVAADVVTLNAVDNGWYDELGDHVPGLTNYIVGQNRTCPGPNCVTFRNWFVFNLAGVGNVTSATLRIPTADYNSPDATETFSLFDVATPIPTLRAGGSGLLGIYADLGTGASYGSRVYSAADDSQTRDITLNAAAIAAINAALGGDFALGGALTSLSGIEQYEFVFGNSQGNVPQLIVQTPEPVSLALLGLGLAAVAVRARESQRRRS